MSCNSEHLSLAIPTDDLKSETEMKTQSVVSDAVCESGSEPEEMTKSNLGTTWLLQLFTYHLWMHVLQ